MKRKSIRNDNRGQMPFALIAVTLLLLTAFYGVVCYSIQEKEENTDGITEELMSVSEGIEDTEKYIEAGLGNIINEISTDRNGGNLVKRTETFNTRMDEWFSGNFPLRDNGASVEIVDYQISLSLQNMKLSSGNGVEDENTASYLQANGTATVRYITESTETEETLDITSDGLSGLPFVINSCTKFDLSATGGQSVLVELIAYQLTALAQYRILNGYGSVSEAGDTGTDSIITAADVSEAFRNALSILESLCFRTNGENDSDYVTNGHVDAAELLLVDDDGYLTIDLSSIFSQTLISLLDIILVRWFDLMCGNVALDIIDGITDVVRKCIDCIISFFTGGAVDRSSAMFYFNELMGTCDIDENTFRYLASDTFTITYGGGTYAYTFNDKTQYVTIPSMNFQIGSDGVDIYQWGGWDGFVDQYHNGRNDIREMIKTYIHSIANGISSGIGTVKIKADAFDGTSLSEEIRNTVRKALNDGWDSTMTRIDETIANSEMTDPLYAAMYSRISDCREDIYGENRFSSSIEGKIRSQVNANITAMFGAMADGGVLEKVMDDIRASGQIKCVTDAYSKKVSEKIETFRQVLTNVPKDTNSFIKEFLISSGRQAFHELDVFESIEDNVMAMCEEMLMCINVNSQSGIIELENVDSYLLYDSYGNSHTELISLSDSYELKVNIVSPTKNQSKNYHNVGFDEISMASYTAVCTISIESTLHYDVTSTTSTLKNLGTNDSEYSGSVNVNTTMDIPYISGWGLAGVQYQSSTNILNEIWKFLLEFLEPILGPLMELYKAIESLFNFCSSIIAEISTFVSDVLTKLFELLMAPIDMLTQFINDFLASAVNSLVSSFNIGLNKQTIVFGVMGFTLKIETKLATMFKTTKSLAKVTIEKIIGDTKVFAFVEVKEKSDKYMVQGGGGLKNGDYDISIEVDPLMKFGKQLISADGHIRDIAFDISLPYVETYDEVELKLSDVPGVSEAISNIPLPIPGVKGSFDMGFELKYNLPVNSGLVINEFESNPEGKDAGKEWVELYNGNLTEIDVTGYVLTPGSDASKSITLSGTIEPLGHMVVYFDEESLANSKTKNTNGDKLTLYDAEGNKVNETGWKKDSSNNDFTWQRKTDGASTWVFKKSTEGKANGNLIDANALEDKFIVQLLTNAMDSALEKLDGHIKSYEDVCTFLKYTVQYFINSLINKIADCVISAMAYIQLQLDDYSSSMHGGIRLALAADSDLVEEGLKWILSQIDFLADYVKSPSCSDPLQLICENTYVTTMVYGEIGTPSFLKDIGERVTVGVVSSVNISGLCSLVGIEEGKWKAKVGILMEDVPGKLLPSPLKKNTDKHTDLWLIRAEFGAR